MNALPRRPVLGWASLYGARRAPLPALLDRPGTVLTHNGRAAILLALEAAGVGPGDRVLVPTYHCPTMVSPVHTLGAQPLFFPLTATGAPDLQALGRLDLSGCKVLLAAHYFGLPQPMEAVATWCRERGVVLVEDCAHALFGQAGSRPVGGWGRYAIGSLTKFLPVADGGCLVDNGSTKPVVLKPRPAVAQLKAALDAVELGAVHGRLPGLGGAIAAVLAALRRGRGGPDAPGAADAPAASRAPAAGPRFVPATRLDPDLCHRRITAPSRWLARWLPRERIVERRRRHHARLCERLAACRSLRPLAPQLPEGSAPYVFALWADQPDPGYQRLREAGVPVYRWDERWPGTPDLPGDTGLAWSHHVLQIGCHQDLRDAEVDHIADVLLRVFEPAVPAHP